MVGLSKVFFSSSSQCFISPIRNIYSGFVFQMLSGMHLLSFATDVNVILGVLFFHNEGTGPISNNYIPSISFFVCGINFFCCTSNITLNWFWCLKHYCDVWYLHGTCLHECYFGYSVCLDIPPGLLDDDIVLTPQTKC